MRKLMVPAAIAALSFGASAAASPFSLTASSDVDRVDQKAESRGLIETVFSSTANAFGVVFSAGEKHEDDLVLRYYKKKEACEADESAELEVDVEEVEKKALAGPEPMYFGF